jgi:hypothetical protein
MIPTRPLQTPARRTSCRLPRLEKTLQEAILLHRRGRLNAAGRLPGLAAVCAGFGWGFIRENREIYSFAAQSSSSGYPRDAGLVGDILPTSGTTCAYKKILVDPAFEAARYAHRQYPYGISDRSEMRAVWAARPHGPRLTPCSGQAGLAPTGGRRRDYPHTIDLSCPADFGGLPERYR